MMARVLTLLRALVPRPHKKAATPRRLTSRRHSARLAVWSGVAAFVAATLALAGALEAPSSKWRDPEFAVRLNHLRDWKAKAPDRPLVLFLGSSRTQMGIDPAAMGFPDEPGSPLVYNFGYRAAHPLGSWFQLMRLLDAGVKPDFVLVQVAPAETKVTGLAEKQLESWAARMTLADHDRLAPYTGDPLALRRQWAVARLSPWSAYREAIRSDLIPRWNTNHQRLQLSWERTDPFGFTPHHIHRPSEADRQKLLRETREKHTSGFEGRPLSVITWKAFTDLVERCRAEGIAVAFWWAPESPTYRSWYTFTGWAMNAACHQMLSRELGAVVFPAPDHLTEHDFIDGFHLLQHGAEKYSQWLAQMHLKPWLAQHGRTR